MSDIPATMKAVCINEPGGPEALQISDIPVPQPAANEVLIKIGAAGVNRPDCLQRQGLYPPPPGASEIPGLEVAGIVVATGADTSRYKEGDRVCALLTGGGYAEYCVAPEPQCLPVPDGLSMTEAAAVPETFFTVWSNVFQRGALQAGETLLVHAGASGIGTTAIQLGKAFGATVIATAGSDKKVQLCESLGADQTVNYRDEDFVEVIKEAHGGVDVILDIVGADYLAGNAKVLKPDGRLVVIAVLSGAKAEINLAQVLMKRLTVTGSTLRARPVSVKQAIAEDMEPKVWPLLADGTVKPVIQQVFPLAEAGAAQAILDANEAEGKVVLAVTDISAEVDS